MGETLEALKKALEERGLGEGRWKPSSQEGPVRPPVVERTRESLKRVEALLKAQIEAEKASLEGVRRG